MTDYLKLPHMDWPTWCGDLNVTQVLQGDDWAAFEMDGVWCGWRTPGRTLPASVLQDQVAGVARTVDMVAREYEQMTQDRDVTLAVMVVLVLEHARQTRDWTTELIPTANHDGKSLYEVEMKDGIIFSVGRPPDVLLDPMPSP